MELLLVTRDNNKQDKYTKVVLVLFFILMVGAVGVTLIFPSIDFLFFSIPIFTCLIVYGLLLMSFKRFTLDGHFTFSDEKITIVKHGEEESIDLALISKLTFYFRGIDGDSFELAPLGRGFLGYKDGAGNMMEINTTDKKYFLNILLENDGDFLQLKNWIQNLRDKDIFCRIVEKEYDNYINELQRQLNFEKKLESLKK